MTGNDGRKPGFHHHEHTRNKIKATQLINRLYKHATSAKPIMETSQVNAAKVLLGKVLPDLQSVEAAISGKLTSHIISDMPVSATDWKAKHANGKSNGSVGTATGPAKGAD